jgi:colanic acid biosynthesis glycosyl transferase WcaI
MTTEAPLRLLIVSQYFWPESFRINDLAARLRARGHHVSVLTGLPNYPSGRFFDGYTLTGPLRERHDDVPLQRVPLVPRGSARGWRLALNYLSFAISASLLGPWVTPRGIDAVFVFAPSPPTVVIPALLIGALRRRPVVFWVQDLWPEALVAVDAIRNRSILGAVGRVMGALYRRCDLVLGQSPAAVASIRARAGGGASDRVRYFPCSAEDDYFAPVPEGAASTLAEHGVPDGFRLLFAGNLGAAQDLETLIDAADRLRARADIQWVFLGDGRRRDWLAAEIERRALRSTVRLLPRRPLAEMPAFFASADALLVSLKDAPGFTETIPSKVQACLASGRPLVGALNGEGARIIRESGAGVTCHPGNPAALARTVADLAGRSRAERDAMGGLGRDYYRSHFDRDQLIEQLESWLRNLCVPAPRRSSSNTREPDLT